MDIKNINTLFLDWSETLSTSKFWEQFSDPKHKHFELYEQIQEKVFKQNKALLEKWMRGQHTTEEVLIEIASDLNFNYEKLLSEFIYSVENMKFVSDDIVPIIKLIQSHNIKVVVATDNMDYFHRWTNKALDLNNIFDGILNSYYLKVRKNDFIDNNSLFFDPYIKSNNIDKTKTVLIDDSVKIRDSIEKYGMNFIGIEKGQLLPELKKLLSDLNKS